VLVTGWFSTEDGEITAGDMLARDTVCAWLAEAGVPYDVAMASGFRAPHHVAAGDADPERYSDVLFVCGPVESDKVARLLRRFAGCRRIAVGTSMPGDGRRHFDAILARDGMGESRPDLSLGAPAGTRPVVAVTLAHPQPEYGARQRHDDADRLIRDVLSRSPVAPLPVDTRLAVDDELICSEADQLQSVLSRVDAVLTTRLHGLVLALRGGVPPVALDPIAGGAKVAGQAEALGWTAVGTIGDADADAERLAAQLDWCLSAAGRAAAAACARHGARSLSRTRTELLELLGRS
jgi:hypothetical protein